jgi:diguanylate cyclase (GGDEF)-like protein/PAS domain S-box-containing protein
MYESSFAAMIISTRSEREFMVSGKRTTRSGEFAESIINTVREPLVVLDQDLRVVSASRSFYKVFKVKPEETVGQLIYDLGNKQWDIPKLRELLETILPQKTTFDDYEVEHVFSAIGRRIMLLNARQIQRGKGEERIILLAIEDITARKKIEAGLEKTRKKLAIIKEKADEASEFAESIINTVREPLVALDQDLRVVSASRSFYKVFKVKPEETVGQLIYDLGNKQWDIPKLRELLETILPERTTFDDYEVEHVFSTIGRRIMLLNARQIKREKGKKRVILLAIEDITTQKELEREILSLAYHDHLTGLPNRMLVIDRFNMAMSQADRNGMKVALMMLDLDKFKEVNDTLGHHIGDKLLQAVAEKMTEILRKGDTVGRFGGDEFVFVLSDQKNDQNGLRVAKKIIDVFRNAFVLEGHSLRITSSIGISLYPDHGADIDTILKKADSAMYQAKQAGRNQYSLYSQA